MFHIELFMDGKKVSNVSEFIGCPAMDSERSYFGDVIPDEEYRLDSLKEAQNYAIMLLFALIETSIYKEDIDDFNVKRNGVSVRDKSDDTVYEYRITEGGKL